MLVMVWLPARTTSAPAKNSWSFEEVKDSNAKTSNIVIAHTVLTSMSDDKVVLVVGWAAVFNNSPNTFFTPSNQLTPF